MTACFKHEHNDVASVDEIVEVVHISDGAACIRCFANASHMPKVMARIRPADSGQNRRVTVPVEGLFAEGRAALRCARARISGSGSEAIAVRRRLPAEFSLARDVLERALDQVDPLSTATTPLLALLVDVHLAANLLDGAAAAVEKLGMRTLPQQCCDPWGPGPRRPAKMGGC